MAIKIEPISGVKNKLGEGPVWDVAEKALYWIDGAAPAIYRLDQQSAVKQWKLPKAIGSFAIRHNGGAICALSDVNVGAYGRSFLLADLLLPIEIRC